MWFDYGYCSGTPDYNSNKEQVTYTLESIVKVADVDKLAIKQTLILVPQLLGALLGNEEP